MRKIAKLVLTLAMAITLVVGSTSTVTAARPVDDGKNYFTIESTVSQIWSDSAGIFWNIVFNDFFSSTADTTYIYGWDPAGSGALIVAESYDDTVASSINYRKGIATFSNSAINITVLFNKNDGFYDVYGSNKEGGLHYEYVGPATIKGTVIVGSTTYIIDGPVSGNYSIVLREDHSITK